MALHLFLVLLNLILNCHATDGRATSMNENMEMATKPTIVADEFDCVDLYKQPAFSHPALKHHKLQLKPSFPESLKSKEAPPINSCKSSFEGPGCPSGMVPIPKRIQTNDSFHPFNKDYPGQHFSVVRNKQYLVARGAGGIMNACYLQLQPFQVSGGQIWLQNGPTSQLNSVQAGWEVNPILYLDNYTRLTTFWTADNFATTGCYNTLCPGFVQVFSKPVLGQKLPTSTYKSDQCIMGIMIKQDRSTGNWWLILDDEIKVGYWPKELFIYLGQGATVVQYGGWTVHIPGSEAPPMGNGEWASRSLTESAYVILMKLVNENFIEAPPDSQVMERYISNSGCYFAYYNGTVNETVGETLFYGGPGGPCDIGK